MTVHDEVVKWLEALDDYVSKSKEWNTDGIWVCESHPMMPHCEGYSFDCKCGGPGMAPIGCL